MKSILFRKLEIVNRWIASFLFSWAKKCSVRVLQFNKYTFTKIQMTAWLHFPLLVPLFLIFNLVKIFNYSWSNSIIWILKSSTCMMSWCRKRETTTLARNCWSARYLAFLWKSLKWRSIKTRSIRQFLPQSNWWIEVRKDDSEVEIGAELSSEFLRELGNGLVGEGGRCVDIAVAQRVDHHCSSPQKEMLHDQEHLKIRWIRAHCKNRKILFSKKKINTIFLYSEHFYISSLREFIVN